MSDIPDFSKYFSGECSDAEKKETEEWLSAHEEFMPEFELMQKAWSMRDDRPSGREAAQAWTEFENKINEKKSRIHGVSRSSSQMVSKYLKYAAVLVMFLLSYPVLNYILQSPEENFREMLTREIVVSAGQTETVLLPDGSKVTLDAGSVIAYPDSFAGSRRLVEFSGEAYFEVARNPEKPFVVHSGNAVVTVLGTRFNVRSWAETEEINVAVAEGGVSLRAKSGRESSAVILKTGEMSRLRDSIPEKPVKADSVTFLSWMNREKDFYDTRLAIVIDQLERWYDLTVEFSDPALEDLMVTIHLSDRPIRQILELIATISNTRYTISGSEVLFSKISG